ncbi:MAG: hypothetical protein WA994_01465 [Ornithinimicrobium sp.]
MAYVVTGLAVLGFSWLTVLVHESGHLLAGRVFGVPSSHIRIVLGNPSHVALREGDRWIGPDDPGYVRASRAHREESWASWIFVATGLALETCVAALGVTTLTVFGHTGPATTWAWTTGGLATAYLVVDLAGTARARRPVGDHSALWQISPAAALPLLTSIATVKVATVALV